jgi:hypothetical protein
MSAAEKVEATKESVKAVGYNQVVLIGQVTEIDIRDSGAAMIWIQAGTRGEEKIENAPSPSWFTPIMAARIPSRVLERTDESLLMKGAVIVCDGNLQGMLRVMEGKPFYTVEVQVTRIRPLHNDL